MKGYSVLKKNDHNNNEFWEKLSLISDQFINFSSLYSKESTAYYKQKFNDEGFSCRDLSFIVNYDNFPICAFLGSQISKDNKTYIKNYEIPSIFIENKNGLTLKQKKKYFSFIEEILSIPSDLREFSGVYNSGRISYGIDFLLKRGLRISKINFSRKIDLENSEQYIKSNIRKCFHSLINWGLRELDLKIIDSSNISIDHIMSLRDLHIKEAGRITRSMDSWISQYQQIKSGPSFMISGYINKELVTSGIFICNKNYCYYGVSASRRDLFEKPLFHAVLWKAIINAKTKQMKLFETGAEYINTPLKENFTEKESNIGYFKSGFGGRLYQELVIS